MKKLLLAFSVVAALVVSGCAGNPELALQNGYKSASAAVRATTELTKRDAISVADAENALALGRTAKATLDAGKEDLARCRAAEKAAKDAGTTAPKCALNANINLGSGVLSELEKYLKAREKP